MHTVSQHLEGFEMAFHPSPNFNLNFRTSESRGSQAIPEADFIECKTPHSPCSLAHNRREDWLPAMKKHWQEYARQTKQFLGAGETLFPGKDENASFAKLFGTIPDLYTEIHEALNRFDRSDENLTHPDEIAILLDIANESLQKIATQAAIARKIVLRSSELHRLVEELFRVKQISNAFFRQLVKDIRLDFPALKSDLPPVLNPVIAYENFLPSIEWQSEPQVYGQGLQTAYLLLYVLPEFPLRDREIDELIFTAIMQDIGLFALEKIHRQSSGQMERSAIELFEQHPGYSVAMLSGIRDCPIRILKMVGEHHERFNGTGFPKGDSSRTFSLSSRLLALASRFVDRDFEDTIRQVTTNRTLYDTAFMHDTCENLRTETLRERFDFDLTQKFIEALKLRPAVASSELFEDRYRRSDQAEKLLPQPQLLTALGLSKVKPRFSKPS